MKNYLKKLLKPKTLKTSQKSHQTGPKITRKESARAPRSFREGVQTLCKELLKHESKTIKKTVKSRRIAYGLADRHRLLVLGTKNRVLLSRPPPVTSTR